MQEGPPALPPALLGWSSEGEKRQPRLKKGTCPPGPFSLMICLCFSDCRSCTCKKTALSCWRTRPWLGSPHWHCWTSAGTSWAPSAGRPCSHWPACRSCASQVTLSGGKGLSCKGIFLGHSGSTREPASCGRGSSGSPGGAGGTTYPQP